MPRILLIVDEFQEFFVEDDKIAQEVALLLDRLVRQGRAFGMHVILGSQTLGGAYSLARSTLGQMAVRIALQCSEADAHLILSEDNTRRPAAHPARRGDLQRRQRHDGGEQPLPGRLALRRAPRELPGADPGDVPRAATSSKPPPIVFEGNLPADVSKNPLLNQLLEAAEWPEPPRPTQAWLGDAIAIKDPTAVVFRPQSGSNLLIVGQNDEAALAMMMMSAISIAAQHPPGRPAGLPRSTSSTAARSTRRSPASSASSPTSCRTRSTNVTWRELGAMFAELAAEIDRRQESTPPTDQAPIFIFIYDIQRFRDLRKSRRRLRLLALRRRQAAAAVEALRRRPPRRPAGRASTPSSGATASTT